MLRIADKTFESHLFTGTGKFAAPEVMVEAIRASGSQLVTLAMKRVDLRQHNDAILAPLLAACVSLLPNTSGATTSEEAVFAARLAREALGTHSEADMLRSADKTFESHLFTGTGKFAAPDVMVEAIRASGSQLVTLAMKRVDLRQHNDAILAPLLAAGVSLLPNTSGAKTAEEAVFAARLAREALGTHWLKLEIHPDARWLLPDPIETLKAAEILVREGFVVLPYCGADPVLCKRLEEAGCAAVMPLGAPIGSNQGLETKAMLEIIIEQATVPVVVDAGIGVPSHAAQALEMGADAVLVNTAIAVADDPVTMARAFRLAIDAGLLARQAGPGARSAQAQATSPLTGFLEAQV